MTSQPSVLFACPLTSLTADTNGKYLLLAAQIAQTYPLTVLLWHEEVRKAAHDLSLPYLHLSLFTHDTDRIAAAQRFASLLSPHPVNPKLPLGPSWAELLAYDDFIGLVQGHSLTGSDVARPSIFLTPLPGAENNAPEDEQTKAPLLRWSLTNQIPVIGIETQTLSTPYTLQRFPVTLSLIKDREKANYTTSLPLSPLARYCCTHLKEQAADHTITHEPELRKALSWSPGTYYLYLPFHPYYIQECISLLQLLAPLWPPLKEAGCQLLISCGLSHRRGLSEKDILLHALSRWLAPFPFHIVENGVISHLSLLSEAVLLPYPHSMQEVFSTYHLPVFTHTNIKQIKDLRLTVRPQEAISYVLSNQQKKESPL